MGAAETLSLRWAAVGSPAEAMDLYWSRSNNSPSETGRAVFVVIGAAEITVVPRIVGDQHHTFAVKTDSVADAAFGEGGKKVAIPFA